MPVRASRRSVYIDGRLSSISISIHVPYDLRTHLEPIVHTTDIKIPIISLSLHALTGRSQSSTMAALSLSNSLQLMMRSKKCVKSHGLSNFQTLHCEVPFLWKTLLNSIGPIIVPLKWFLLYIPLLVYSAKYPLCAII